MTREEIMAITLLLLHTWSSDCVCSWFSTNEGKCSRCFALAEAQEKLPYIYLAFTNTIEQMESQK